jgi:S-layer family protein
MSPIQMAAIGSRKKISLQIVKEKAMKTQNEKSNRITIAAFVMAAPLYQSRSRFIKYTKRRSYSCAALVLALMLLITAASTRLQADTGMCGGASITLPFTDVASSNIFFCSIAAAYFSGLTNGTTATTYSPSASVTREQMAAFITRTQDSALRRGSLRAALNQWASRSFAGGAMTTVGSAPAMVQSDGADLWVANSLDDSVSRVRASDGKLLETWTPANEAWGVLVARGRIYVTGATNPGSLYRFDPRQPAGDVVTVTSMLGSSPQGITTDGEFICTANAGGSVSKVDPGTGDVSTFTVGFNQPYGILYDGSNIWVTDFAAGTLLKLNSTGTIAQAIGVGTSPQFPIFDGTNIWVPNSGSNSMTVVRASTGTVLATLTLNGLDHPNTAAFDGERVLVTNVTGGSVSLWKAVDLTPLGSFDAPTNSTPVGACSDGISFWVTLEGANKLARF